MGRIPISENYVQEKPLSGCHEGLLKVLCMFFN